MKLALASLIASTLALSACAPNGQAPTATASLAPGDCFQMRDMEGHRVAGPDTLYIGVRRIAVYRLDMAGGCLAASTSSDFLITRRPPGSERVCRPIDIDLAISRGDGFSSHCFVKGITKLSPTEVAALPAKLKP
jgi:Family of unknown function (DUF6491)